MRIFLSLSLLLCLAPLAGAADFVKTDGGHFVRGGKPYYFVGANFWQGMNLGSKGPGGDRARLDRELDRLKALGVTNLRIVAASEGPDSEPWRMVPALQKRPGEFDAALLDGLDYFIAGLGRRGMTAVVVLNDFWPWSGGMAQYVNWRGGGPIPYPPPAAGGDWGKYQHYAAQFYSDKKALADYKKTVKTLVERKNAYTGRPYKDEPAIMAWELANEPRGDFNVEPFNAWLAEASAYIKSLDANHLVTAGSEGDTPYPSAGMDFARNHAAKTIDYSTIHIWAQNWGWYDPASPAGYAAAAARMREYLRAHLLKAKAFGKPLVLEEFGLGRDGGSYDPAAGTGVRDKYYAEVFEAAYAQAKAGLPLAGVAFWAWAGESRPASPGGAWKAGDPWTGDPPHELQGWYSVYDADAATARVIKDYAAKFAALSAGPAPLGASFPCNAGDLADSGQRLDLIKKAGFSFVSFIPNYTYAHLNEIDFSKAPSPEELSGGIEAAMRKGLGVVLKPHLEPAMYQPGFSMFGSDNHSWRARTGWRGFFDVDPMTPDYREKMVFPLLGMLRDTFERLDADKSVPAKYIKPVRLELGTELMNSVVYHPERWEQLLAAARAEVKRMGLDGRVLLSHNFCHHFEIPEDFVLRMSPEGRAALARYIKGLDAFAVSQYMDLTVAMPADERGRRNPTTSEVAAALLRHDVNIREEILGRQLGLKPEEMPPFHIGEFGVGRGGLRHPNLWEGAATPEEDAEIKRQIAIGHRGLLQYLRSGGGRSAGSATLWLTGRYYDLFGWMNPADAIPEAANAVETGLAGDRVLSAAPADFGSFWQGALDELAKVPPALELKAAPEKSDSKVTCFKAAYSGLKRRLHAWYCRPAAGGKYPAVLISPWFGQGAVDAPYGPAARGVAALAWQARGYDVDLATYPADNSGYALEGADSAGTYFYRELYANAVRGLDVLASRPEVDASRLGAAGSSQGGGVSLALAGLDSRVAAVAADFPFMSGLRLGLPASEGTVKGIRELAEKEPARREAVLRTASYFDTFNFAPLIKAPALVQAGLKDRSCPPAGIRSVYETIPGPKAWREFPDAGHSDRNAERCEKMLEFIYGQLAAGR